MQRYYSWDDILVMPDDVIAFAWSAPMRDLAAQIGLSDVGLKKILASHGVVPPPQGYWNKLRAGKPVASRPKAPARKPGERGRIRLDARFGKVLTPVAAMPSSGPFVSAAVPEDLKELLALELKAIGRAVAPKTFDGAYGSIRQFMAREDRRREKVANSEWHWDGPKFDNPVAMRRLRILNGIFLTLAKRGHGGEVDERDEEIFASAIVGDTRVSLDVGVHGKHSTVRVRGYLRPDPDLPASTPLKIRLDRSTDSRNVTEWVDDQNGKLEQKLPSIVAGIIVEGEKAISPRLA